MAGVRCAVPPRSARAVARTRAQPSAHASGVTLFGIQPSASRPARPAAGAPPPAQPARRAARARGRRQQARLVEAPVPPLHAHGALTGVGPELAADRERLHEAADPPRERHTPGLDLAADGPP